MKKCCMIGCGNAGVLRLGRLIGLSDMTELTGFCDLIEERAERLAAAVELSTGKGAAVYTDYRDMLDCEKPDMVFLCVPPYCCGEIEHELIGRGIPFFTEAPMALDPELAREIRDSAAENGLITAVSLDGRYSSLSGPCAAFVRENEIVTVRASEIGGAPESFWQKDKELSGGLIMQSIHTLDTLRYVLGEPEEVFAYGTRGFVCGVTDYNSDDAATVVIKFENGTIGTLTAGCFAKGEHSRESVIGFSAGARRAELRMNESLMIYGLSEDEKLGKKKEKASLALKDISVMPESFDGGFIYRQSGGEGACERAFVEAVVSGDGSRLKNTYAEAVKTLELAAACTESLEKGVPVKVIHK